VNKSTPESPILSAEEETKKNWLVELLKEVGIEANEIFLHTFRSGARSSLISYITVHKVIYSGQIPIITLYIDAIATKNKAKLELYLDKEPGQTGELDVDSLDQIAKITKKLRVKNNTLLDKGKYTSCVDNPAEIKRFKDRVLNPIIKTLKKKFTRSIPRFK
jgi:hypothetical protein